MNAEIFARFCGFDLNEMDLTIDNYRPHF